MPRATNQSLENGRPQELSQFYSVSEQGAFQLCPGRGHNCVELAEVCEVVIELCCEEVWLVHDNIYANMLSA